jgi:hypothetical protein
MIKKSIGWLLEKLLNLFDREIKREDIRDYVRGEYKLFQKAEGLNPAYEADLAELADMLNDLGWLEGKKGASSKKENDTRMDAGWLAQFKDKKVYSRGVLLPGSGRYLDLLDETARGAERKLAADCMEKILRHVEVKREKSLRKFTEEIGDRQAWLERLDISLLFSRTARRHHDLRFLNASLKMNEWYLHELRNSTQAEIKLRLLLALAEQEKSAGELLV